MKRVYRKTTELLRLAGDLYWEMTLSALTLLPPMRLPTQVRLFPHRRHA